MPIPAGTKLGPYEIQSQIGAGGMGEVYRARDSRLGREVAIKILPESFAQDAERLRRFEQESHAVAALNHPNILAIYDVGTRDTAPYLVSELLEGESLRAVLEKGPIPQRKAIEYAVQIANGLAAAHDKGIVHRDLKPDNLFICRDGRVKILDFGLAKLSTKETPGVDGATMTQHTAAGVVMGTASYMAPEQVRGGQIDARTDMFSFGVVLYEMLSGKRAFQRDSAPEIMTAILREDIPEFSASATATPVSPALERIVRRCLEKSPDQRFQSAKDLAFALEAVSQISGPKSGAQAPILAAEPEHKSAMPIYAGALVFAAAMLGLGWWLGHSKPPASPTYRQFTFRSGFMGNARFVPDGSVIYNATWEGSDMQLYIAPVDSLGERELPFKNAEVLSVSSKGELAIRLNSTVRGGYATTGTLARVNYSGGTPRPMLENVQDADWSADGEKLAVVHFLPETGHWRLEYPIGTVLLDSINWMTSPRISADGKSIAFLDHENTIGDDRGTVAVVGMDGKEKKLSSGWNSLEGVLWSPSGSEIWFSGSDVGAEDNVYAVSLEGKRRTLANIPGGLWVQDIRNGKVLAIANRLRLNARGMPPGGKADVELGWLGWTLLRDISRDGKQVLFEEEAEGGGPNYTVFLRGTDGSPPTRLGEGLARALSPDEKWVVTQDLNSTALKIVPTGAGDGRTLTHDSISYNRVRYMPDGKHLIATGAEPGKSGRTYLIDAQTGDSKPLTPEGYSGTAFSHDGSRVAMRGPDGTWGLWTMADSKFAPIPSLDPKYGVIDWTRDDRELYVISGRAEERQSRVFRLDPKTGKMEFWKEFGGNMAGIQSVGAPIFAQNADAYAYVYTQILSEGYVVSNLQ
ncbi:MAG TPA: protein kinase [Candidatus Acidoferrum sp.]|jgi:serine/threonine protein kinase/Tol biopolymer transport system component